jgi:pyrimidine operon attenuation protein/uracil phosphoribosyltransferase
MPGNPLPDAEQLLKALIEQMRPAVGPETGLVGIHTGGVWVAERLHQALKPKLPCAFLDVSYYRDDYSARGLKRDVQRSEIPFEVEGRDLILVDDVLYTGRSVRSALDALRDIGRPRAVQLAVLVDRGHRELPLRADYVGKNVPTSRAENVKVRLTEDDQVEGIWIAPQGGPAR